MQALNSSAEADQHQFPETKCKSHACQGEFTMILKSEIWTLLTLTLTSLQTHHSTPYSVHSLPHARDFMRDREMYYGDRERDNGRLQEYDLRYECRDRERERFELEREREYEMERERSAEKFPIYRSITSKPSLLSDSSTTRLYHSNKPWPWVGPGAHLRYWTDTSQRVVTGRAIPILTKKTGASNLELRTGQAAAATLSESSEGPVPTLERDKRWKEAKK